MNIASDILERLRAAAAGFPNPGVNDTVIVRRGDLRAVLLEAAPGGADVITDRDRIAFLRTLVGEYRRKRAVDGLCQRNWDGAVHWKAEQAIVQLEAQWAEWETERHLADAETPP
jgi:hypothetical protein